MILHQITACPWFWGTPIDVDVPIYGPNHVWKQGLYSPGWVGSQLELSTCSMYSPLRMEAEYHSWEWQTIIALSSHHGSYQPIVTESELLAMHSSRRNTMNSKQQANDHRDRWFWLSQTHPKPLLGNLAQPKTSWHTLDIPVSLRCSANPNQLSCKFTPP